MVKKFFVWADANCNGQNIEWIELTGEEFYFFLKDSNNRNRRIIKLSDPYFHECDVIYIEATEEQYYEWNREYKHSLYINRSGRKCSFVSLQEIQEKDESFDIPSYDSDIESLFDLNVQNFVSAIETTSGITKTVLSIRLESAITGVGQRELIKKYGITQYAYYSNLNSALEILKTKIFS